MSYCSFSSCMVFCISCSEQSKNKSRSHTHSTEFLEIFVHPRRPTEYPSPFLFILPEFGKRYLQEECWQRGQSINQASGILKELCLISASGMIAKKWHIPWNNNKEHCPCYEMQKFAEKVQSVKIWFCQRNLLVMSLDMYCIQKYHNYCFNDAFKFWVTFKTQYCQQKCSNTTVLCRQETHSSVWILKKSVFWMYQFNVWFNDRMNLLFERIVWMYCFNKLFKWMTHWLNSLRQLYLLPPTTGFSFIFKCIQSIYELH